MLSTVLPFVIGIFCLALLLCFGRLLRGPNLADRILALDTLSVNALALLILLGIYFQTTLYFEAALMIAMLGFVGTVVMAKFLNRGDIAE
ncbi:K+/H+ antiporter subunit F [Chitinimonas sp. BJB300]|uniref:K+/H+ antiporter subunit F n=1 Tax=Chitinimonas sp. BJB300 TaxID=1559339 RepID=UPI000C0EAA40|nr:K+/H+ antiporter subunit F [Chitinimonas sp. BJB300]PHV12316.1 K+/H+ antiporter subunit F [Chitinimonas sp. BJB300]TSJ90939.1 K+/H+ antiporter subunit F [Chitinimonas sp. BJB300]